MVAKLDDNFDLVCAIDFGTTFSGYAYSFRTTPDKVDVNKNWAGAMGFEVRISCFFL